MKNMDNIGSQPSSLSTKWHNLFTGFKKRWEWQKDAYIPNITCSDIICHSSYIFTTILLLSVLPRSTHADVHVLHIDNDRFPLFITNSKFLSVAVGASLIAEDFKNFDMKSPRLLKLMTALSPGYLRIGGTMANKLWFVPQTAHDAQLPTRSGSKDACNDHRNCRAPKDNFIMSGDRWLEINKLALNAGLKILFDINVLPRLNDNSWDSSNAEKLIEFSNRHNLSVIWELGNEPTLFKNHHGFEITAQQLARDFIKFRTILNKYPSYREALLVGPDMSQPKINNLKYFKYFQEFLENGAKAIDAITWHQYNVNGSTTKHPDFLNPEVFDGLKVQILKIQDTIKAAGITRKRVWLGETASAYGGGAPAISDRYVASFLWLDKLGVAAQNGLDIVIRQTLFKGHYALIDEDLTPLPDLWLSIIYKRLVGTKVISCSSKTNKYVRLYCHCAKKTPLATNSNSIVVFGMNLRNYEEKVQLNGITSDKVSAYVLTANSNILFKKVLLNNAALIQLPNGDIPVLKPNIVKTQPYLTMPPLSLAFWVIPTSSFNFCETNY